MNVVFHASAGPDLAERLQQLPGLSVTVCTEDDTDTLFRLLPDCDVLWHVLQPCTRDMIAAASRLKLIQKIGVGVNTIDLAAARKRGISVCNLPGTNARAVAELTLGLMLSVLRRIPRFDQAVRSGVWTDVTLQDGVGELGGRKVGLIGFGSVPKILTPILVAFGCTVIYHSRSAVSAGIAIYRPFEQMLEEADIVSLHLPLVPDTARIINHAALRRMRRGAILINTGRGGLVDQPALVEALASGHLGGAGLDVFEVEPPAVNDALLRLPNVVLTPHVGWLTTGTFDRSFSLAAENCHRITAGRPLLHQVV
jgi:phosphoglycerate dehydrogenase-like enzyme